MADKCPKCGGELHLINCQLVCDGGSRYDPETMEDLDGRDTECKLVAANQRAELFSKFVTLRELTPEEGGGWYASIPALGEYAFCGDGDTPKEAIDSLIEVAQALCKDWCDQIAELTRERDIAREALGYEANFIRPLHYTEYARAFGINGYEIASAMALLYAIAEYEMEKCNEQSQ